MFEIQLFFSRTLKVTKGYSQLCRSGYLCKMDTCITDRVFFSRFPVVLLYLNLAYVTLFVTLVFVLSGIPILCDKLIMRRFTLYPIPAVLSPYRFTGFLSLTFVVPLEISFFFLPTLPISIN